ncbi:AI-2E family transporter [Candidatus Woesearchaeota archaeon]|nr:AI-2E family transporter [Candidatus Woesearchaeota archaeon]
MNQINKAQAYKYFLIAIFVLIVVLAVVLVLPFITPILTSFILAYIFYPFYKWLARKTKRKNISALIISIILILLLVIPVSFTLYQLTREANIGYVVIKQKLAGSSITEYFKEITGRPEVKAYIENSFNKLSSQLTEGIFNFIFTVPARLLDILLTFFFTFFLLRDGANIVKKIEKKIPLKEKHKKEMIGQVNGVIYAIINGFFVIAIIQGVIGALTFKLFGVASPVTWGILIALLAFVPFLGAALIWIPAAIIQAFHGSWINMIGITIGGLIISYIDTFLKPKIIGDKAEIHPAIILIGLLGGLKLLGIIGIIIGPIILSLFFLFIDFLSKNK